MDIIISEPSSKQSPLSSDFVKQCIVELMDLSSQVDAEPHDLIDELLNKFKSKSSRHKFIVQVTKLAVDKQDEGSFGLEASTEFGAVWDSQDGVIKGQVKSQSVQWFISIFYIFIG